MTHAARIIRAAGLEDATTWDAPGHPRAISEVMLDAGAHPVIDATGATYTFPDGSGVRCNYTGLWFFTKGG